MKNFFLVTNKSKDPDFAVTRQIEEALLSQGGILTGKVFDNELCRDLPEGTECVLVLGGDGTILRTAGSLYLNDVPFLGINAGHLGYLTEGSGSDAGRLFEKILRDEYYIEDRMLIKGMVKKSGGQKSEEYVALNDIVLGRNNSMRIIEFELSVNGELLYTYNADGMIVSTPTGSTAYNLSCGGPIVEPTARLFLLTPIASHSLNNRSLVLSQDDEIELKVLSSPRNEADGMEYLAYFDGDATLPLSTGDTLAIRSEKRVVRLVRLSSRSFLETLKVKMS